MPDYKPGYLTLAGQNLAQQAVNAQIKLQFTRAVISSDDYSNTTDDAIRNLTTLSSFTSINIGYGQQLNSTDMVYPLRFSNYNLTQDNYVRTIGVYASDGTTEYLYSVLINQSPEILSAYNGSTPETIKVNFQVYVGLASQVKVVMQDIDVVTVEQLSAASSAANSNAQSLASSLGASESADIVVVKSETGSNAARIYNLEQKESGDASAAKSQTGSNATRIYNLEQLEASDASVAKSQTGSNAARIYNLEQKESGDVNSLSYMVSLNSSVASTYTSAVESDKNNRVSMASYTNDITSLNSNISLAHSETGSNATRIYNLEQKESGDASAAKSQTGSNATRIYNLEQLEAGDIATVKSETGSNATRIFNLEQKQSGDDSVAKSQVGSNATRIYNLEQKESIDINNLNNAIATINNYNNSIKLSISQTLLYKWDIRTVQMANINPNKTLVFYYFPESQTLRFQGGIQAQAGDTIQLVSYGIYGAGNYMALNGYTNVDIDSGFFDSKPVSLIGTSANAPWYSINIKVYQDGWIDFSNSWIRLKFS